MKLIVSVQTLFLAVMLAVLAVDPAPATNLTRVPVFDHGPAPVIDPTSASAFAPTSASAFAPTSASAFAPTSAEASASVPTGGAASRGPRAPHSQGRLRRSAEEVCALSLLRSKGKTANFCLTCLNVFGHVVFVFFLSARKKTYLPNYLYGEKNHFITRLNSASLVTSKTVSQV